MMPSATRPRRRGTLLIGLVLVALALIPRLLTYDRYLPYSDYTDESVYVALADEARGFSDQTALRTTYGLLAPLYLAVNVGVQIIHDALSTDGWRLPVEYYTTLRLVSVGFGVLTTLLIAWIGGQLAGRPAALLAGTIWALAPIVVDLNSLAIPDPLLYAVCALAVGAGVAAWQRASWAWLTISLIAGIAALYTKLWPLTALLPFIAASGLLIARDWQVAPDQRRWLGRVLILCGGGAAAAVHFVLVLNPLANTLKMQDNLGGGLIENLFSVPRVLNNLWHLHYPITRGDDTVIALTIAPVLVGGGMAWWWGRRRGWGANAGSAAIVGLYTVAAFILTGAISNVNIDSAGRMRHLFPTIVAFIPLWAAALMWLMRALSAARAPTLRHLPTAAAITACGVFALAAIPELAQLVQRYQRTHTVALAMAWFDGSPPRDGTVLLPDNRAGDIWNRLWGAYGGSKPFDYLIYASADAPPGTPADDDARGVRWWVDAAAPSGQTAAAGAWADYADDLWWVKTIAADEITTTGPTIMVYRFDPPDQVVDTGFGGLIRWVGYDLRLEDTGAPPPDVIDAGTALRLRPYWQRDPAATTPIIENYSLFVHLYRRADLEQGTPVILAQVDTQPLHNTTRLTSAWTDRDERYFAEPLVITVPADLAPGDYVIAVGLYNFVTGARLPVDAGGDYAAIPITVR